MCRKEKLSSCQEPGLLYESVMLIKVLRHHRSDLKLHGNGVGAPCYEHQAQA